MSESLKLAAQLARKVGMVPTWPNVQTIRLAIESEAEFSGVSLMAAADVIAKAAREWSRAGDGISRPPSDWLHRAAFRENLIDRFWFEDARWRTKFVYEEFRAELRDESA